MVKTQIQNVEGIKLKREQKDPNSYPRIQEYRVKKTEIQRILYVIYFIYF